VGTQKRPAIVDGRPGREALPASGLDQTKVGAVVIATLGMPATAAPVIGLGIVGAVPGHLLAGRCAQVGAVVIATTVVGAVPGKNDPEVRWSVEVRRDGRCRRCSRRRGDQQSTQERHKSGCLRHGNSFTKMDRLFRQVATFTTPSE
jgi:hypothetical protein